MATLNKTREAIRNRKKVSAFAAVELDFNDFEDIAGVAELVELPEDALIIGVHLNVKAAFNAGTSITVALKADAATIAAAISIATTGVKTLTVTKVDTGNGAKLTATAVIVGALPTTGLATILVEYVEYNKNTGELTPYSTT